MHDKAGRTHTAHHPGVSSLGVLGVSWHPQILADQLTLYHLGGTDYAHLITTDTPEFSDLPMALTWCIVYKEVFKSPCTAYKKSNLHWCGEHSFGMACVVCILLLLSW